MAVTWVKVLVDLPRHPKFHDVPAGTRAQAVAMHVAAICSCAEYLTDGFIDRRRLSQITASLGIARPAKITEALVVAGLWHHAESGPKMSSECIFCDTNLTQAGNAWEYEPAGKTTPGECWYVHGYLSVQLSRGRVESDRSAATMRQSARRKGLGVTPVSQRDMKDVSQRDKAVTEEGLSQRTNLRVTEQELEQEQEQQQVAGARGPTRPPAGARSPAPTREAGADKRDQPAAAELTEGQVKELVRTLEAAGWRRGQLTAGRASPALAYAWLAYAEKMNADKPGAYAWTGFETGRMPNGKSAPAPVDLVKILSAWIKNVGRHYQDWRTCEDEIAERVTATGQQLTVEEKQTLFELWDETREEIPA